MFDDVRRLLAYNSIIFQMDWPGCPLSIVGASWSKIFTAGLDGQFVESRDWARLPRERQSAHFGDYDLGGCVDNASFHQVAAEHVAIRVCHGQVEMHAIFGERSAQ